MVRPSEMQERKEKNRRKGRKEGKKEGMKEVKQNEERQELRDKAEYSYFFPHVVTISRCHLFSSVGMVLKWLPNPDDLNIV